ncbi:hypothetical protein GF402_10885 [Candidatus Fermentibacteria bacterium]|nr:hypothetical protein [Candidatus Fermentibacteria bacterium]
MSLIDHWKDRHPQPRGGGRIIVYVILLVLVVFLMLKAEDIGETFAVMFSGDGDTTEVVR